MENLYYKYLPIERLTYLDNQLIRFTQPSDLNDPFECLPQKPSDQEMDIMVQTIEKILVEKAESPNKREFYLKKVKDLKSDLEKNKKGNLLDRLYFQAYEKINNEIGILSLSQTWNNTLMWAHYVSFP